MSLIESETLPGYAALFAIIQFAKLAKCFVLWQIFVTRQVETVTNLGTKIHSKFL
jgi:hypothetical protein